MSLLPILVLLFVVMWLLVIRPQRKRQAEQKRVLENLSPGQEVLTAGGLYGTVHSVVDEDEVRVEIAPDVQVRVSRGARSRPCSPTRTTSWASSSAPSRRQRTRCSRRDDAGER